jgi:arginase
LIQNPWRVTEGNQGVQSGGDEILTEQFLSTLTNYQVLGFDYTSPDALAEDNYFQTLKQDYNSYDQQINTQLDPHDLNILVGGDHSVSFGSYLWLCKTFDPQDLLVIHIDTHPDIMLVTESQTLNFHGKWQRPFYDKFDKPEIEGLIPHKLLASNLIMFGNFDDEQANMDFLVKKQIAHFTDKDWNAGLELLSAKQLQAKHIHISFDVDSLDQSIMPATGIPCQNGLSLQHLYSILDCLDSSHTFSIDIVEYNPVKDLDNQSKKLLQDFIRQIISRCS